MKNLLSVLLLTLISTGVYSQIGFNQVLVSEINNMSVGDVADVDGDGDIDIITKELVWYENLDGLGNFGPAQNIGNNSFNNLFAEDLDGDGDIDICVQNSHTVGWYENTDGEGGNFMYRTFDINMYLEDFIKIVPSDFDGDGDIDILYDSDNYDYGDKIGWFKNDGEGNFDEGNNILDVNNNKYKESYFTDADGDGDTDLMVLTFEEDFISFYPLCI